MALEMSPTDTDVYKVSVVGEPASGKSVALGQLVDATREGTVGYEAGKFKNIWAADRETRALVKKFRVKQRADNEGATERAHAAVFDLTEAAQEPPWPLYSGGAQSQGERSYRIAVLDVPGEIFRDTEQRPKNIAESLERFEAWLSQSDGVVFFVPAPHITRAESFEMPSEQLFNILEEKRSGGLPNLRRMVIAVSMFDTLLMPFADAALDIASQPAKVRAILALCLKEVSTQIREMIANAEACGLDLRIIATSSYGFEGKFGCPNLDPDRGQMSPTRLDLFPVATSSIFRYLVPDPFIWAATGADNDFLFPLRELVDW